MSHALTAKRKRRRLSLRALARLTDVHYLRLQRIEHGKAARPDELVKLAKALGCTPAELAPRSESAS